MKYLLIKQNGEVKEFVRLPRAIHPKDVLIEVQKELIVNKVVSLTDHGLVPAPHTDIKTLIKKAA